MTLALEIGPPHGISDDKANTVPLAFRNFVKIKSDLVITRLKRLLMKKKWVNDATLAA